jgi:hypothetical protein
VCIPHRIFILNAVAVAGNLFSADKARPEEHT